MIAGLSDTEIQFITDRLITPLKKKGIQVFLFGSRARGAQQKFSDIDILYSYPVGHKPPGSFIHQILAEIEDSDFPYKIDLVDENELAQTYRDQVQKERRSL